MNNKSVLWNPGVQHAYLANTILGIWLQHLDAVKHTVERTNCARVLALLLQ